MWDGILAFSMLVLLMLLCYDIIYTICGPQYIKEEHEVVKRKE